MSLVYAAKPKAVVFHRLMRPSYHSNVSMCYTQEKTEKHLKNNHMATQTFPQIGGKPCSLILWVHAAPISHSETSIHLDTNVISKKTRKK